MEAQIEGALAKVVLPTPWRMPQVYVRRRAQLVIVFHFPTRSQVRRAALWAFTLIAKIPRLIQRSELVREVGPGLKPEARHAWESKEYPRWNF